MKILLAIVGFSLLSPAAADATLVWTQRLSGTSAQLDAVAYNGSIFVACASGNSRSLTSTDGISWTLHSLSNVWIDALCASGATFVGVGSQGRIYTSENGANWTLRHEAGSNLFDVAAGNGVIVAVGSSGRILRSADSGATWQVAASPTARVIYCVAYGGGQFVALSYSSTNGSEVLRSTDGLLWQLSPMVVDTGTPYSLSLSYGNGVFVTNNYRSTDMGSTWKRVASYSGSWDSRTGFGNNTFLAVRTGGGIQVSTDSAVSWANSASNASADLHDVEFGRGMWIAVGNNGLILTSASASQEALVPDLTIAPAVEMKWRTQRGVVYQMQYSTELQGWTDLGPPLMGDGNERQMFEAIGSNSRRFYRVKAQ
jgi:trimeric autotransporter adhesin